MSLGTSGTQDATYECTVYFCVYCDATLSQPFDLVFRGISISKEDDIWKQKLGAGGTPNLKNCKCTCLAKSIAGGSVKSKGDNIFLAGSKGGLAYGLKRASKDIDDGKKRNDGCFFHLMRLQMITTMPFQLVMSKILQQFKLNISYIDNIKFVDAYIMLSRSIIYFQYEIVVLYTKVICVTA